ncbi:hypothetical protein GCM10010293_11930 [Streptomyces griseoflavus]|nr:hypothetical protein GCM10010293_11930 [Streptomyces griseoflavus]
MPFRTVRTVLSVCSALLPPVSGPFRRSDGAGLNPAGPGGRCGTRGPRGAGVGGPALPEPFADEGTHT